MTAIRLGFLGGFELHDEHGAPLPVTMRKAKALMAWLALHPGRPQHRDRLAGLLWTHSTEPQARHSLRQALSLLRRSLPDSESVLLTDSDTVTLVVGAVAIDVEEFRTLAVSDNPEDLERAAALYRGDFLEAVSAPASAFEDWVLQERSALRELAGQVHSRLLDHYRAEGAWEPAVRSAVRLLALDPLRESVHRELMVLYVRLGRPAQALHQYRTCKALMHQELNVAPEGATVDLYRHILGDRAHPPLAKPDPALVGDEGGASSQPDLSGGFGLVGREAEARQLVAALDACREAETGLTLLVRGAAGIGKSSLSVAACGLAQARGYRTHLLRLPESRNEAGGAPVAVLVRDLLGLPGGSDTTGIRTVVEEVCADPHAALFLLDVLGVPLADAERSFYLALDPRSRSQVFNRAMGLLLTAAVRICPRLLVVEDIHWADPELLGQLAGLAAHVGAVPALLLLTSRIEGESLNPTWRGAMQGAPLTTLDLGPLRPEAASDLARRRGAADEAWIGRCLERSGGNPLFLEHLLDAGPELADNVPSSVQGLVERELARHAPDTRRAVQAAAVLGQSFSAPDLSALLGPGIDVFGTLSETRLVRCDGAELSFSHALVRDGIYQSIADPARVSWHRRAADWYRDRDPLLHAEHLERADDPGAVHAWLSAARLHWDSHRYESARDLGERAWRLSNTPEARAEAGLFLAVLLREVGEIAPACRILESVVASCKDERALCDARIELAAALLVQDDYRQALRSLDAALATAEVLHDHRRLARLHYNRGNAVFSLGSLDACMDAHAKALEHARAASDSGLEARALSGLGDAFYQRGRMVTAHHYYDRCLRLCEANDLLRLQPPNLAGRAMAALYLNRLGDALADADTAVRLAVLTRNQRDECLARNVLCLAAIEAGDFERVESEAETGLMLARSIGARRFEADHVCMRGVARAARGEIDSCLADLESAYAQARRGDLAYGGPWILGYLAQMTLDPNRRCAALAEGEAALCVDSVSHNHLQFRQCALEIALQGQDWEALEHQARELETYTRAEPLPWSDFHVGRARALMAWARGPRDAELVRRLRSLEAEARHAGLGPAAVAITAAIEAAANIVASG